MGRKTQVKPLGMMRYPNRLYELRSRLELKQTDIAETLGITKSTYHQYEQGNCDLPAKHIIRLCREYGCSADWLICASYTGYAFVSLDRHEIEGGDTSRLQEDVGDAER